LKYVGLFLRVYTHPWLPLKSLKIKYFHGYSCSVCTIDAMKINKIYPISLSVIFLSSLFINYCTQLFSKVLDVCLFYKVLDVCLFYKVLDVCLSLRRAAGFSTLQHHAQLQMQGPLLHWTKIHPEKSREEFVAKRVQSREGCRRGSQRHQSSCRGSKRDSWRLNNTRFIQIIMKNWHMWLSIKMRGGSTHPCCWRLQLKELHCHQ
jgi:hypothetical protein